MNFAQARTNMVTQQIQPLGVSDNTVLSLLDTLPRDAFVPSDYQALAYADMPIPLAHDQQMLCPKEEAMILQALDIQAQDNVLEIGTGSGYMTALLASLCEQVYSVDIFPEFVEQARAKLKAQAVNNATVVCGDALTGWHDHAPYDVIVVTGALPSLPASIKDDLVIGGRVFAVLGQAPAMSACVMTRIDRHHYQTKVLFETQTPYLINKTSHEAFVF